MSRHSTDAIRREDVRDPRSGTLVAVPVEARRDGGQRWEPSGFRTQVALLAGRSLRTAFGDYRLVFFGLLQPVVMLLLFSQVFKQIGTLPGVVQYQGYINFLMPATLVNIAMTTAMSSGVGVLTEIHTGFIDRLRAMPISLMSVLVARTLSDAIRLAVQLVVAVIAGVLVLGFRPAGIVGVTIAVGLTVVVGWGLGWLFVAIATWQRKPETMQALSFVVMFPLMFGSSAYMPVQAMPGWLRAFSAVNPLTYAIDATRALTVGRPAGSALLATLGLVLTTALFGAFVSARSFRRTT
ncbi:MAG: ABC transporter permease [Sciscionella sp.]